MQSKGPLRVFYNTTVQKNQFFRSCISGIKQYLSAPNVFWSFSFSINPSNGYSGLISFRMEWLYLLAVQGTLKSLFQHHNSKASILRHLAFLTEALAKSFQQPLNHLVILATIYEGGTTHNTKYYARILNILYQ